MKKILYPFILMFAALAIVSCGDDNDDPVTPDVPGEITYSETSYDLDGSDALTFEHSFDAPEKWKAVSNADWCKVVPAQGLAGKWKLAVEVSENKTTELRTAEVEIKTIDTQTLFNKLVIKQPGCEPDTPQPTVDVPDENPDAPIGMRKNAPCLVSQIRVGWNLGNTCESGIWEGFSMDVDEYGETAWGNPKTTQAMIAALKGAGFNAIRIPCRWYVHADADMNIRETWMKRIKEIVDYAYNQGMYVILNSHHDNWYDRLPVGYDEQAINKRFATLWTQIANHFRDYDEHLVFAGVNEIVKLKSDGSEDWGTPTTDDVEFVNNLMQTFVNTVRATGGNNAWRCLMVQPWAASPGNALRSDFRLPSDAVEHRIIVEYHCYDPYNYAIGKDVKNNQWAQHEVTEGDKTAIAQLFARLNDKFVSAGTPCIMAEFGSTQDNSYAKGNDAADRIRADYHRFVVSEAKQYNIPGFYWDNGCFTTDGENFALLDRSTCTFPSRAKTALDGIMSGL